MKKPDQPIVTERFEIFRQVYDANPDGVLLVNAQGVIEMANPAVTSLLGYSQGDLHGQPVDMLVPDSVAARHAAYRAGYAKAPRARPMGTDLDLKARRSDGSEIMVEISLSPLRGIHDQSAADAALPYVVVSIRGTGAYPRVIRALQRARYSEFAVQLGRVAVDTVDPDELLQRIPPAVAQALEVPFVAVMLISPTQQELRMVSHSGAQIERISPSPSANREDTLPGYVVAQRVPVTVADFALEQRFAVHAGLLDAGMRGGLAVPLVDRGRVIGVVAAWSPQAGRFGDDEVAFLESLASLLTTSLQRTHAEQQLRHAQRLESVGQLTGGIAHDFNNLLTVIQGNLQMLGDLPAVQADAVAPALVAAAARAGQRGADLTGKLLAFSRRQPLTSAPLDPSAMLQSLADMLRRTLGDHIHVEVVAPAGLPRCIADAVQLESALLNVAINARDAIQDAMQKGLIESGELRLSCGAGTMPADDDADWLGAGGASRSTTCVWFSVQDNGCGMTRDVCQRAFEPFFTTKEAGRGTGLGLSTVYGFVTQSHGRLRLHSEPGKGTTLSFVLPALDLPATLAVAVTSELPRGLRVLLVEDDHDVRAVAQSFLRHLGCDVQACATGEAAQALLLAGTRAPPFDILFSDITLGPGINGIDLATRVQAQHPHLKVLLCSGYSRYLVGADMTPIQHGPVLRKPFTQTELAHALAQCLQTQDSSRRQ